MKRILCVDDDAVTLMLLNKIFEGAGYSVESTTQPLNAQQFLEEKSFDIVVSDYFMPELNGDMLLKDARRKGITVPFVFLTANSDIQVATDLVKIGAEDYIVKPFNNEDVLYRVKKALDNVEQRRTLKKLQEENQLYERENQKLVNWRVMYGSKRIRQMEQMIHLLSRNINQTGGFMWVDILKDSMEPMGDGYVKLNSDIANMVLTAGQGQQKVFEYLNFIGTLENLEMTLEVYKPELFFQGITTYITNELVPLAKEYNRVLIADTMELSLKKNLKGDLSWYEKVLRELVINAIKYSPEGSTIRIGLSENTSLSIPCWDLFILNDPLPLSIRDSSRDNLIGIPYDYSEQVFDLFFTIENHPRELPCEEWSEGTGLYVCRQLLDKMGAAIQARNGVYYKAGDSVPFVRVTITIPSLA